MSENGDMPPRVRSILERLKADPVAAVINGQVVQLVPVSVEDAIALAGYVDHLTGGNQ